MADQHDSWDEAEVQWGSAVVTRIRAKETSGSTDARPATGCAVGEDLETTSVTGRGAVQRDSSILRLAVEDPDATLPYDPRRWTSMDLSMNIDRNVSLTSQREDDIGPYVALSSARGVGLMAITFHYVRHNYCGQMTDESYSCDAMLN